MSDTRRIIAAVVAAMLLMVGWQILTYRIWGLPPRADAGPDQTVPAARAEGAEVVLDGSRSQDPDSSPGTNDDLVAFEWYENYGQRNQRQVGNGERLAVGLGPGPHAITLVVRDRKGRSATDEVLIVAEAPGVAGGTATGPAATQPREPQLHAATGPASAEPSGPEFAVVGAPGVQTALLGGERPESGYNLAVLVSSDDACVLSADLTTGTGKERPRYRFRRDVDSDEPYPLLRPLDPRTGEPQAQVGSASSAYASLITTTLRVFRDKQVIDVPLEPQNWNLRVERGEGEQRAVFWVTIVEHERELLRLQKTLRLSRGRYDVELALEVQNLSDEPIRLSLEQLGAIGMKREDTRSDYRKIVTVHEEQGSVTIGQHNRSSVFKKHEPIPLTQGSKPLVYAALVNKYFTCIMGPQQAGGSATMLDRAEAVTTLPKDSAGADLTTRWITAPVEVAPHGAQRMEFALYWGPKLKDLFQDDPVYAGRRYGKVISVEYGSCCAAMAVVTTPLGDVLVWLLKVLHHALPNYGVAIIILVLLVRAVLHPITKKSQVNMMKMQKNMSRLQPKVEALRQKFGSDKSRLNQEMMRLYREEGINPAGQLMTCLPMGLQMPIWIALWTSLNTTIELRHAPFVLWIRDLAGPDALIRFGHGSWIYQHTGWVPFIGPLDALNLLPLILGVSMYLQQRFSPKPTTAATTTDQQKQQQLMMNFMSVFFTVLFYNMPSGLNLYIGASNLFGMLEQWRIRKHAEAIQPAEAAPAKTPLPASTKATPSLWSRLLRQVDQARQLRSSKKKTPRR